MSGKLRDNYLLYRIRVKRDADAYGELYDRYVKRIYRFVYFKVSSQPDAEDITSDVFLKAWEYLQQEKEVENFSALAYKIARNLVIDFYRERRPSQQVTIEDALASQDVSDFGELVATLNIQNEAQIALKCVQRLKEEYREVLLLRFVDELDITTIGEILGKSQINTRVLIHRALKTLRKVLERQA